MAQELQTQDWYKALVDDLKSILTEGVYKVRSDIIEMKWEIGDRLVKAKEELKDLATRVTELATRVTLDLSRISEEVKISSRELERCIAFREKFPTLKQMWATVPEGKNISWHKLVNKYIDFTTPKPEIPVKEITDEWGICDWWRMQKNLTILKIISKDQRFALTCRPYRKQAEIEEVKKITLAQYKELQDMYIELKHWSRENLGKSHYTEMRKGIRELLELSNNDVEKVKYAIMQTYKECKVKFPNWNIFTVVKHYPNYFK
jgi:hypothetical protein